VFQFQELGSRRFQHGFDGVNLHRLTLEILLQRLNEVVGPSSQGLTLVHYSPQHKHFPWGRGCIQSLLEGV